MASPGPFDIRKAQPLMKHKFQSIYGLNMKEAFYNFAVVPAEMPIRFMHDANAVLEGELWKGEATEFDNVAVVTLGTGLGFAVSENRKVLCNEIGGPFISIFRTPYEGRILEDYTARRGFLEMYLQLKGEMPQGLTVAELGRMADHGDKISQLVFLKVGEILAHSLKEIIMERQIQCLLFGGQISKSFHLMKPALEQGFSNIACLKRISQVSSIDSAALTGAVIGLSNQ